MKIVIISGCFNPIHPGHLELFCKAKSKGHLLWVIVKNDKQTELKRGTESFQDQNYRKKIVTALRCVDKVFISIDNDLSVNKTLKKIVKGNPAHEYILAKGGDAKYKCVLEEEFCKQNNIKIIKDLGKKKYSSSHYVNKLKKPSSATKHHVFAKNESLKMVH